MNGSNIMSKVFQTSTLSPYTFRELKKKKDRGRHLVQMLCFSFSTKKLCEYLVFYRISMMIKNKTHPLLFIFIYFFVLIENVIVISHSTNKGKGLTPKSICVPLRPIFIFQAQYRLFLDRFSNKLVLGLARHFNKLVPDFLKPVLALKFCTHHVYSTCNF